MNTYLLIDKDGLVVNCVVTDTVLDPEIDGLQTYARPEGDTQSPGWRLIGNEWFDTEGRLYEPVSISTALVELGSVITAIHNDRSAVTLNDARMDALEANIVAALGHIADLLAPKVS